MNIHFIVACIAFIFIRNTIHIKKLGMKYLTDAVKPLKQPGPPRAEMGPRTKYRQTPHPSGLHGPILNHDCGDESEDGSLFSGCPTTSGIVTKIGDLAT
ncbi:hypothetical protein AVEN_78034-1 [Araneus ventricosus]|uniref:Uncharacterized protein n=1 Tax=Araneus ventricosus TaxID=182803 RepID=A0A4Y2FR28_ARAVE|nr:hypothetical protein AVEN_78034-1 [Araneus ventricosus]